MNGDGVSLNLVVIRARSLEVVCRFYEALGLRFSREQHGKGPLHYACDLGSVIFEIYPLREGEPPTIGARLGFVVSSLDDAIHALGDERAVITRDLATRRAVLCDPEGHRVEVVERGR